MRMGALHQGWPHIGHKHDGVFNPILSELVEDAMAKRAAPFHVIDPR